jgi:hypothetical protein
MIVVVRTRERPQYGAPDIDGALANLQPRPVIFTLTSDGRGPEVDQLVRFIAAPADPIAEGSYLVVANDKLPGNTSAEPQPQGLMNGHVFRIGNPRGDNVWELSPETEFEKLAVGRTPVTGLVNAGGYVIGRTRSGPAFEGQAQDVAVFTMMIAPH